MTRAFVITLILGLSISTSALGQAPAPTTSAAAGPAPALAPAPAAASPTPAPAAEPAAAAPAAPPSVDVPPGYMLVPIPDASSATRYDVQYPQARGALPPGMELPYEDGDPIPPGYRMREQPRRGLVIAGSIMTGVPWVFSVTGAVGNDFEDKTGFLLIPGIGPWLMLAAGGGRDRDCQSTSIDTYCDRSRSDLRAILVLDGLVQTAGATMFVLGLKYPRKRLVRQDVTVSLAPTPLGSDGYGLGALGTF